MINLSRKLYISMLTLVLLVVVAGTVTFAWFKLSTNAWFENLQLTASTNDNLLISVDGVNYDSQLSSNQIASSMIANYKGYTLKCDGEGDQDYWLDSEENEKIYITDELIKDYMNKISLKPVTTCDGINFTDRSGNNSIDIKSGWYFNFDVYFKAKSIGDDEESDLQSQGVYFSNRTYTYADGTVIPRTEVVTIGEKASTEQDFPTGLNYSFKTYNLTTGTIINYNNQTDPDTPGYSYNVKNYNDENITEQFTESFRTYVSNAMRFSLKTTEDEETRIYELNKGNGSYATTLSEDNYKVGTVTNGTNTLYVGASGAAYDSTKNAAFTYYNEYIDSQKAKDGNTGEYVSTTTEKKLEAEEYDYFPSTYKGLDTIEAAKILTLNEGNNYGKDGNVKMTITLWLEGWDADCIDTVLDQQMRFNMSFTNYGIAVQNKPYPVTYWVTDPNDDTELLENLTRTKQQIHGMIVSDDTPAYVSTNTSKKFVGWAYCDENRQYIEYYILSDEQDTFTKDEIDKGYRTVDEPVYLDFSRALSMQHEGEEIYLKSVWE